MCNIFDIPREWAEDDKQNEADAFADALQRIKPMDNIHKAYHQGYAAGYKAAEDRILRCMEVPTRVCAQLTEENASLRIQLREQADQIQKLRECIRRSQEEWYD
jgi:hypothetical protein